MSRILSFSVRLQVLLLLFSSFHAKAQAQEKPSLFIGGGALTEELYEEFARLTGTETKLVVIPTASGREPDIDDIKSYWKSKGIKEVVVLHTRDKEVASGAGFADPLKTASAVWFSGGSQSRISDAYLGTPVEEEIYKLSERGGLIGGSSAGAAIMSKTMISGGKLEPEMMTGFNLLPGVILDQHFLKRNRLARLIAAVSTYPDHVGFGIDEATAVLVFEDEYKVIGESYVMHIELIEGTIKINAYEDGENIPLQKN